MELIEFADYVIKKLGLRLEKIGSEGIIVDGEQPLVCYRTKGGHPPVLIAFHRDEKKYIAFCPEIFGRARPTKYYYLSRQGVVEAILDAHFHLFSINVPDTIHLKTRFRSEYTWKYLLFAETSLRISLYDEFKSSYLDIMSGDELVITRKELRDHIRDFINAYKKYSYPRPIPLQKAINFLGNILKEYEISLHPLHVDGRLSGNITSLTKFPKTLIVENNGVFVTEVAYGKEDVAIALGVLNYGKGKCPAIALCEREFWAGSPIQRFYLSYHFVDESNIMGCSFLADIYDLKNYGYFCYIDRQHKTPILVVTNPQKEEEICIPHTKWKVMTPEEWKSFKNRIFFSNFFQSL